MPGPFLSRSFRSLHHSVHAARHAGHAAAAILLRDLGDDRLGGQDVLADRGSVLQRRARDHRGVDDAGLDQVGDLAGGRVQALVGLGLADVVDDDRALETGVERDLTKRLLERTEHDLRARRLVVLEPVDRDRVSSAQQRDAAARHDALLEGGAGGLQRVLDAVLLLLHLGLGGSADLDDRNAAGQLREALLELLAIEVRVGVVDLDLDLVDAALDLLRIAPTVDDGGVVLGDHHTARTAELVDLGVLELEAHLLGDDLATREDRDVLEHALAAVTEARRLDGGGVQRATQLVHDERREGLALDVLGDDQQRLARLHDLLDDRKHVPDRADLLVGDEDVGVLESRFHALLVGHEVRRDVALVELHAFRELEVHPEGLALFDVHDAVLADLLDRVGDDVADLVVTGRDGRDARDLILARDLLGLRADVLYDLVDGLLDAALQAERVGTGRNVLQTVANDRLGQHRRGRRAVTGDVVGRRGDLADELRALVLEYVLDLDLTRDGHTVVRDGRGAELLVKHHVAALGAERDLDRVCNRVDAGLESLPGVLVELDVLVGHLVSVLRYFCYWTTARTSDSRRTSRSSPSTFTSVPPYLE